jgi:predicted  nucleic acid-binding Zn-ribbon protein
LQEILHQVETDIQDLKLDAFNHRTVLDDLTIAEKTIKSLETQIQNLTDQASILQSKISFDQTLTSDLKTHLTHLHTTNLTLETSLSTLKKHSKSTSYTSSLKITALTSSHQSLQSTLLALQTSNDQLQSSYDQ